VLGIAGFSGSGKTTQTAESDSGPDEPPQPVELPRLKISFCRHYGFYACHFGFFACLLGFLTKVLLKNYHLLTIVPICCL
jgi:hypothetical protein